MQSGSSPSPSGEFAAQRESARRSVLRANRAVTAILLVVVLLGVAMLFTSYRAFQSQRRAEAAENQATERLWHSYLDQARAERLSTEAGHRGAALAAISNAAAVRPSTELRDEAIASLGLRDLELEVSWQFQPNAYGFYFDADLQHYVVSYTNDSLSMFRLADNSLVRTFRSHDAGLGTNFNVREFFFSMTGRYIAMYYGTGVAVLWGRDTGRPIWTFGRDPGTDSLTWSLSFSGDDRFLCARTRKREGQVMIVDLESGERRHLTVPGVNDTLRLSPRADVFMWFRGTQIYFHDAATGTLQRTLAAPAEIQALWWDTKGDQLSISCRDSTIHVWEPVSGRFRQLGGRVVNAWMQQFSPDGTLLVTAGADGTSRLWDVADARLLARTSVGRAMVFARDGKRIAYGVPGKSVGVWRVSQPASSRWVQGVVSTYATVWQQDLSSKGEWMVWSPPPWVQRYGFEVFDLKGNRAPLWTSTSQEVGVAFHPSEPRVFTAGKDGLVSYDFSTTDGTNEVLKLNGRRAIEFPNGLDPRRLSISGNGRRAAVMSPTGSVLVVNLNSPEHFVVMEGALSQWEGPAAGTVTGSGGLAMSVDGRYLAAGGGTREGGPVIWDTDTGRVVKRLATSTSQLAFSPDGKWLATISLASCTLWKVGTWEQIWKQPRAALLSTIGAVAFSRDSNLMAYSFSNDQVEMVNLATGEHLARVAAPTIVGITGLRLSSDGSTLAIAGPAGRIQVEDLSALRRELGKLRLDWPLPTSMALAGAGGARMTPVLMGSVGLGAVSLVGLLGMMVLRRHGRLTRAFIRTTEQAAQQARELAAERELNELKSRFVALVSHEFRTPLGITMSAVELLRNYADRLPPEKLKELLQDIYSATLRMSGLMEQVLLLGRVEAGKIGFQSAPMDLEMLAGKLVDETLSASSRRCPIKFRVHGNVSGAYGDESLLRHVFSNLLSNAVKYSPNNRDVEFTVQREGRDAVFAVCDRGIGIPEADRARLFEAFHRASNVGQTPGTGLGLLIVKRCVELHQGTIRFESRENEGTTFTVRLPLFSPPEERAEAERKALVEA
jgi:signal transduction histidine kinase